MSYQVNEVTLIGHLGDDPEKLTTRGGDKYVRASVATSRRWKNKQGEVVEKTEWHRVTIWGQPAEFLGTYGEKGRLVRIRGRLETSSYQVEGEQKPRYSTEVVVSGPECSVKLLDKGNHARVNESDAARERAREAGERGGW